MRAKPPSPQLKTAARPQRSTRGPWAYASLCWMCALSACASSSQGPTDGASASMTPSDDLELCVVRHAGAHKNLANSPKGADPDALTPVGQAQAEALAKTLKGQAARTTRVLTSPELRAQRTGEPIARALGLESRTSAELAPLTGDLSWEARMKAWERGQDPRPMDGEALRDGQWRAKILMRRLRMEEPAGTRVVLVTHADLAAVILGELAGTTLERRPFEHALETGHVECRAMPRGLKL